MRIPFQRAIDTASQSGQIINWMIANYMDYLKDTGHIDTNELAWGYARENLGGFDDLDQETAGNLVDYAAYVTEMLDGLDK